jgi:hypothetical protein
MTLSLNYFQVEFKPSDFQLDGNKVGKLITTINTNAIDERFKGPSLNIIPLEDRPFGICVLPNNNFITVNYESNSLTVYNELFKPVEKIDKIDRSDFEPIAVVTDGHSGLYILDISGPRIIKTNFDFVKIGEYVSSSDKFWPFGMCFLNGRLYVTDSIEKQIFVFDMELNNVEIIQLEFEPLMIQGCGNTLCITSHLLKIFFYDLETLDCKFAYSNGRSRISVVNNGFYEVCTSTKKIVCYNSNGSHREEIIFDKLNGYIRNDWDGLVCCFRGKVFVTLYNSKALLNLI